MNNNVVWAVIGTLVVVVVIGLVAFGSRSMHSQSDDAATGIPEQDADLVARGEIVYQASCAVCHGTDLRGTDRGPSHLSVVYEPSHHGDVAFVLAAQRGVRQHHWRFGDMPPVPGLTDDDLEAVVAYVRENQRIFGFEPYPP